MAITRHRTLASVVALGSILALGSAHAQPKGKTDDKPDTETARTRYKQGKAFLDAKLYDDAIHEFEAAYQIAPVPELLFNIAQADRLKGDAAKAIEMYRRYIEQAPNGSGADEARLHIANLTKLLRNPPPPKPTWHDDEDDKIKRTQTVTPSKTVDKAPDKTIEQPPAPAPVAPVAPPTVQPMPEPEHPDTPASHHRAVGRYFVYGGLALGAVMGTFLYLGGNENDRIHNGRPGTTDDLRNAESIGTVYNWTAGFAGVLGVASLATGITMILRNPDDDVHVGAVASPAFTGLVLSGQM